MTLALLKPAYRRLLDLILAERHIVRRFMARHLPATGARLALDLGAGASPFRAAMQQNLPGLRVVASDRQWRDVDLVADAARLPFAAGSLDLVSAFQLLQYTESTAVLSEIRRVLRPGGHCLLLCPCLVASTSPADQRRWTQEGLAAEVTQAGFTPVAQSRIGGIILTVTGLAAQAVSFSKVGWITARQDHGGSGGLLRLAWNLVVPLPLHLLGLILLPLDQALPASRFYIGSIILARRNDDD